MIAMTPAIQICVTTLSCMDPSELQSRSRFEPLTIVPTMPPPTTITPISNRHCRKMLQNIDASSRCL